MRRVTLSLDEELVARSKEHCVKTGKSFSGLVRVLLQNKLQEVTVDG